MEGPERRMELASEVGLGWPHAQLHKTPECDSRLGVRGIRRARSFCCGGTDGKWASSELLGVQKKLFRRQRRSRKGPIFVGTRCPLSFVGCRVTRGTDRSMMAQITICYETSLQYVLKPILAQMNQSFDNSRANKLAGWGGQDRF